MGIGRPSTCQCGECKKCKRRLYMRDYYRRTRKSYPKLEIVWLCREHHAEEHPETAITAKTTG